jgi:hypothetical protein
MTLLVLHKDHFGIFPMPGKKPSVTVNQERADGVHGDFFRIDVKAK